MIMHIGKATSATLLLVAIVFLRAFALHALQFLFVSIPAHPHTERSFSIH